MIKPTPDLSPQTQTQTQTRPQSRVRGCLAAVTFTAMLVALAGCDGGGDEQVADGDAPARELRLVYVNWADGVALTHLAKVILEDQLGYDVELVQADVGPVYQAVAVGEADAFLDAWLPSTHEDYLERFGDQLVDLGPNYVGCQLGLVVPADAPGTSISDLNEHAEAYDGQIVGIDAGSGIMRLTGEAAEAYGLDLKVVPSSGPAMTAALKSAVDSGEPIVVTGWKPHWKFARWNLRFLDDPKGVYGQAEEIRSVARVGFEADHPEAAAFLRQLMLTDQQLGSLMGAIKDSREAADVVARAWLAEHADALAAWLPAAATSAQP